MNCKDCLHYEKCHSHYTPAMLQVINGDCAYFTDRSEWVHLPCKVGDIVWYITGIHHSLIKSARVEDIIINEPGIRELYISLEDGCYFYNAITYNTREEAEEVLKALEGKKSE